MSLTRTVVPAHPGWFVCSPLWKDHECTQLPDISRDPVIAWLVTVAVSGVDTACYDAHPVTADDGRNDDEDVWLMRPDGMFVQPECRSTFDEDEVRQFMLEDQQRHLARSG